MSTRKGAGETRTRKPKHQNTFAFRHNPKSQKTAKILASVNAGLCPSCHDKVEWRKRYRKYKPLRQPATCNDCHKKTITAAYHKICAPCARERRVCPWCCTKGRPRETSEDGVDEETETGEGEVDGDSEGEVDGDSEGQVGAGNDGGGKAGADDFIQEEGGEEGDFIGEGEQAGAAVAAAAAVRGGKSAAAFCSTARNSDGSSGATAGAGASEAEVTDDE
eukprot:g12857.t1